jgi:tetratricopeptide (TPR) repeat protein
MANYWAAQVFLKKGDRRKALTHFEKATEKAPNFFTALYALGELNFLVGKPELASEYYQKALKVKSDAGLLIKIGLIYENFKEYDMAEKYYKELIRMYPDFFIGYNQLAWFYAGRGVKLEKAMSLAEKADKLQPGNSSILDTIGWIYFQKKEYEKALQNLKRAHKIRPGNPTVLYHIGAVYHVLGDKSSADRNLKKALSI